VSNPAAMSEEQLERRREGKGREGGVGSWSASVAQLVGWWDGWLVGWLVDPSLPPLAMGCSERGNGNGDGDGRRLIPGDASASNGGNRAV